MISLDGNVAMEYSYHEERSSLQVNLYKRELRY